MIRPLEVLDAYSCAGGAGWGFHEAGANVTGVDINDQPNYKAGEFIKGDAIEFIREHGHKFDLIHTSPPCQEGCTLTAGTNAGKFEYPQLIPATREALEEVGKPYIIENPPGKAPMRRDVWLCGEMFGLGVIRHRNFELGGWSMEQPPHKKHRGPVRGWRHGVYRDGPYIAAYGKGGGKGSVQEMQAAMGIKWTDVHEELTEAIPPAYTKFIAEAFIAYGS